jgi:hypothetical protein
VAGEERGETLMSVAEYLSVFLAIIVGLAVADLATSFHKLLRARERVEWDWLSLALAFVMLLEILVFWWGSFGWYRETEDMSIGQFLPDLVLFLLLFLAVAAVLPDEVPDSGLSLRRHYLSTAPHFWILMVLMGPVVSFGVFPRLLPDPTFQTILVSQWPNLLLTVLMAPLIFTKREWVHMVFVALLVPYTLWVALPFLLA